MILRPVLITIPDDSHLCRPKRRQRQREYARMALRESARLSNAPLEGYVQDASDVPLPNSGFYWSISHTRGMAAGVVSQERVGIDVESITPRREGLFDMVGGEDEWAMLGGRTWENFFRLFTAKEATLKANGKGIGFLRECCLTPRTNSLDRVGMAFAEGVWTVRLAALPAHVLAVCTEIEPVEWSRLTQV